MSFGPYSRCPVSSKPYSYIDTVERYGPYRIIEDQFTTNPSRFSIQQLDADCTRWIYAAGPRTIEAATFKCLDWWEQRHSESFYQSEWSGFFSEKRTSTGQPESSTARYSVPRAPAHSRKDKHSHVRDPFAHLPQSHSSSQPRPTIVVQLPPELCENGHSFAVARDVGGGRYQILTGPRSEIETDFWRQRLDVSERGEEVSLLPNPHHIAGTIVEASPAAGSAMYAPTRSGLR
jgi:hypothetical protein